MHSKPSSAEQLTSACELGNAGKLRGAELRLRRLALPGQRASPRRQPTTSMLNRIVASQTALAGPPGNAVTSATTNLAHLSRFPGIDAQIGAQGHAL
jgi:hypothetical protein